MLDFVSKSQEICIYKVQLSKRQNHEEDCANFCGLLRKAEFCTNMICECQLQGFHPISAKSPLEDGNSDQKISHQHIRQKGSLGHHS